ARRIVGEQWALVQGYLAEYRPLVQDRLPDEIAQLAARFAALEELGQVEQAIEAQEPLRNAFSSEQFEAMLSPLKDKRQTLHAQLWGSGIIAQDGSAVNTGPGVAVAGNVGGHVIIAGQGATVIVGEPPVETPAVNGESPLAHYLRHLIGQNRYLQLQGIRSGGKLVSIELEQIYVTLRATRQRTVQAEEAWLSAEAGLAPGEAHLQRGYKADDLSPRVQTETVTVSVNEALEAHPRLVVLGDPGSGKTTLLRYLALLYARDLAEGTALVKERLGLPERGWLPMLIPLRRLGAFLKSRRPADDGTEGHTLLLEHYREMLKGERIVLPPDFFDSYLHSGQAVILLDGLDEVADPDLRRRVARLVEAFTRAYPQCRYVVSSRIVGYAGAARLSEEYVTTTVRDFSDEDIGQFLRNWHLAVAVGQVGPGEGAVVYAERQTQHLLASIAANERVRELAINPLLLTVIALVHRDRVKLPDRRAELYAEAVDVLLGKWDEARGVQEVAILDDRPFDAGDKRLLLQKIALTMHEGQQKDISLDVLRRLVGERLYEQLKDWRAVGRAVDRFLQVVEERTGLLVGRGEGVYAFSHLTFQEYLAALAVAARDDYMEYTLGHCADAWWREAILLQAGHLSMQSRERATRLIRAIADCKQEAEPYHNLVLAAECLRDVGSSRVAGDLEAEVQRRLREELETPPPKGWLASIQVRLQRGMTVQELTRRRIAAAEALSRIGGTQYWTLPYGEPEWVEVPAGPFWMGSETGSSDEKPLHQVSLPTFHISRVPITNAQYRLFVEAAGHLPPNGWENGRPPKGELSHPVVYVTWHDALAYCRWLSEVTGKSIALPSEAQWEKAARGPSTGSGQDRRAYPWGDAFEATRCNCAALGLGDTTPVGVFPDGASPYGVLDLSGNVWEWTRSLWGKDWEKPDFKYPYDPGDGREDESAGDKVLRVLRGGAFGDNRSSVRCSARYRSNPDVRNSYIGFRIVMVSPSFRSGL
ncbi:MAG: SUMF1/EgtB/PvdO family nonheme iron enzyme, partial [Anaerolineae bacterium]|nr:SUMF1/EgtB/PvdO family nonheme iron enzyme [Anaerolineae bacterium]